jgi:hypothetical protein
MSSPPSSKPFAVTGAVDAATSAAAGLSTRVRVASATPAATSSTTTQPKKSRPSETNKLVTSLMFATLIAIIAYFLFRTSTVRGSFFIPGVLTISTFVLSFLFTSIFQLVRKCPFNAQTISVASGATAGFILFVLGLLSFPWTGGFLTWIVESAFPYVPDLTKPPESEDPTLYSDKDKHVYSYAYSYWMFWAGLLPMYTFLGLTGAC